MNKNYVVTLALLSALSTSHSQDSSEAGFYGFVTAGPTTFDYPSGFSVETNGYQLGLGYEFNENVAFETSYGSLFNVGWSGSGSSQSSEMTMYNFSGVYRIPGDKFTPYVKGGIASFKTDYQDSTYGSGSYSSSKWTYGIGGELNLDARTALRVEYMTTAKTTGEIDGSIIQFGIRSRF